MQTEYCCQNASAQASPACQDQATQTTVEYDVRDTQLITQDNDYVGHVAPVREHQTLETPEDHQEPLKAKEKRAFHDQASQTDYVICTAERSTHSEDHLQREVVHAVESDDAHRQALNPGYTILDPNPESYSSTDVAFFTARNCSTVSQTRRNDLLDVGVSLEPNKITIEFSQGTKVHMLQRIHGGKIILDPTALPRAASSEALAQGEVYTPGYVREKGTKTTEQCSPSTSSSYSSDSSCSNIEQRPTPVGKLAASEPSGTAEDSYDIKAKQHLTSIIHESADESVYQRRPPTNSEAALETGEVVLSTTPFPDLPIDIDSSAAVVRPALVNGKGRSSSVSYWSESEDEDPKQVESSLIARPQTLAQFRSVPIIRVQRPSTDAEMVFGLGTRTVKPSKSASPLVSMAEASDEPTGNVALPHADPPVTSSGSKKRFRERLRDRRTKQAIPVDAAGGGGGGGGGKAGIRARVKRKGSNVGRKGRKKFIFRKKVLRVLLGKELADTISQTLKTTENATSAGAAEPVHVVAYKAVPTSAASKSPLPDPALAPGVPLLAPAQMDGSHGGKFVSSPIPTDTRVDIDTIPVISAVDGSHERKAERRAKKEIKRQRKDQKRNEEYEQAKTNLEALISTPCMKCGGQKAYILNFIWENKKKMLKHEKPEMKKRHRKKEVTQYVENLECRCPRGTGTAAYGSPEAVSKAKEMYGCHVSSFLLARS